MEPEHKTKSILIISLHLIKTMSSSIGALDKINVDYIVIVTTLIQFEFYLADNQVEKRNKMEITDLKLLKKQNMFVIN